MIANPTTLILGAGASAPIYPTGAELREIIINACKRDDGLPLFDTRKVLAERFKGSMVSSIDAFLAEEENHDLHEAGKIAIAAALLPRENQNNLPAWYQALFNAVRSWPDSTRFPIKIVTFNYDLSLEFALFRAFLSTYKLDGDAARAAMDQSVKIIHVYGHLGSIAIPRGARTYGILPQPEAYEEIVRSLKIIGRDPANKNFEVAQLAIRSAKFLAILGFGFDETNVANLTLPQAAQEKPVFSTGYHMGYGMRGWLRHIGLPQIMIGSRNHDVGEFLHNSAFLHWANLPESSGHAMRDAIVLERKSEKYHLPD